MIKFGAGILTQVDRRVRVLWHRTTRETSKLWPLTATAGVSAGHEVFAAELLVLQGHCFHTYDDEGKAEAELRDRVASYLAAEERAEGKRWKAEACWVDRVDWLEHCWAEAIECETEGSY